MDARELELIALNQLLARNRVFGCSTPIAGVPTMVKDLSAGLVLEQSDNTDVDVINVNIENNVSEEEPSTVASDEHEHEEHSHEPSPLPEEEAPQETSSDPEKPNILGGKLFRYFRGNNGPK